MGPEAPNIWLSFAFHLPFICLSFAFHLAFICLSFAFHFKIVVGVAKLSITFSHPCTIALFVCCLRAHAAKEPYNRVGFQLPER